MGAFQSLVDDRLREARASRAAVDALRAGDQTPALERIARLAATIHDDRHFRTILLDIDDEGRRAEVRALIVPHLSFVPEDEAALPE